MNPTTLEVVADASVAAKWQLHDEEHVVEAERLLADIETGRLRLVVPEIWFYEIASLFSKAVANGRIDEQRARDTLTDLLLLPRQVLPFPDPLVAFDAARRFNRTLIDCLYLTIAEERGCDFWTDDRKLARALGPRYPFVRWIGDYPEPAVPSP